MIFSEVNPTRAGVHTEISGNKKAIIEGCDGIAEYYDDKIMVKCGRMTACVLGRDLHITAFNEFGMVIEGVISSVNFLY